MKKIFQRALISSNSYEAVLTDPIDTLLAHVIEEGAKQPPGSHAAFDSGPQSRTTCVPPSHPFCCANAGTNLVSRICALE